MVDLNTFVSTPPLSLSHICWRAKGAEVVDNLLVLPGSSSKVTANFLPDLVFG